MIKKMIESRGVKIEPPEDIMQYRVRAIDASVVSEQGSSGTDWRVHYSLNLFNISCDEFILTGPEIGESCLNFHVETDDLMLGDRCYCNYKGIKYISEKGGYFVFRYKRASLTIYDTAGKKINLLEKLRGLETGEVFDMESLAGLASKTEEEKIRVRTCAIKKSIEEIRKAEKRTIKAHRKKQKKINPEALVYQHYVIIITNLPETILAERILELFRLRWQIELCFRRLKSIFGLGCLPKTNPETSKAWLHGKMLIALLGQMIYDKCQHFSPWVYPLHRRSI